VDTGGRLRADAHYPLLSPAEVLRVIGAMSRAVSADIGDDQLFGVFYRTLTVLMPRRWVAVRRFDPGTFKVAEVLAHDGLVDGVGEMPATIYRGALDFPNVRSNLPAELGTPGYTHPEIQLVDEHPLLFKGAGAGFSVPLGAGGELLGEVYVNYVHGLPDVPLRQDKGLVIPLANHVAAVAHTRRLLAETATLKGTMEQLIDQADVLIVAIDLKDRVTVWNRAVQTLTGLATTDAVGQELMPWLTRHGAPELGAVIRKVRTTGEAASQEVSLPSTGRASARAVFNIVTVRGSKGEPAAVMAVGQDVTTVRSLQSQVLHAEKLATVGQIAAAVAHEINNPLTSIQVCAEAVLRKAELAVQGRAGNVFETTDVDRLGKIRDGAERIGRFARDLVNYARPSGSERQRVMLNEVVEQGLSFCEHVLDGARAEVRRDLGPGLPLVHVIRDQILQVIINLVTNAVHALEGKAGKLTIRTYALDKASVCLEVGDTGVGIKPEDEAQVFEPFFSTKAPGQGAGLGLSVVRNIIYEHGGSINFQSRRGSGTTFVVTLPIDPNVPDVPDARLGARKAAV
jgi:PAS domain S-box-containing protein